MRPAEPDNFGTVAGRCRSIVMQSKPRSAGWDYSLLGWPGAEGGWVAAKRPSRSPIRAAMRSPIRSPGRSPIRLPIRLPGRRQGRFDVLPAVRVALWRDGDDHGRRARGPAAGSVAPDGPGAVREGSGGAGDRESLGAAAAPAQANQSEGCRRPWLAAHHVGRGARHGGGAAERACARARPGLQQSPGDPISGSSPLRTSVCDIAPLG